MKKIFLFLVMLALVFTPVLAQESTADEDGFNYELYGVIAMQLAGRYYNDEVDKNSTFWFNNESRIGLKGEQAFSNFPLNFIWQIESGWVSPSGGDSQGSFGVRDTFVGFKGDNVGTFRFGKMLTPLYELVDWPGSNPGLGDVWDYGWDLNSGYDLSSGYGSAYNDRENNMVRWDSISYAGFTTSLSSGVGVVDNPDDWWVGGAAHYKIDMGAEKTNWLQIDFATEFNFATAVSMCDSDCDSAITSPPDPVISTHEFNNQSYLFGLQGQFSMIGFWAQYRMLFGQDEASETTAIADESQDGVSLGITLSPFEFWQFKLGYAGNFDLKRDGEVVEDTASGIISGQILYILDPSAVLYGRFTYLTSEDPDGLQARLEPSIGVEYYF